MLVHQKVVADHSITAEAQGGAGAYLAPVETADTSDRRDRAGDVVDTKPVTPSSTTSATAPRRRPITGVPQAIASIMERPKGSANSTRCSSATAEPSSSSRSFEPSEPT